MPDVQALLAELKTFYSNWHAELEVDENWKHAASVWKDSPVAGYFGGMLPGTRLKIMPYGKIAVDRGVAQNHAGEIPDIHIKLHDSLHRDDPRGDELRDEDEKTGVGGIVEELNDRACDLIIFLLRALFVAPELLHGCCGSRKTLLGFFTQAFKASAFP